MRLKNNFLWRGTNTLRFSASQVMIPSVGGSAESPIYEIDSPTSGILLGVKTICDSPSVEVTISSSPTLEDIRCNVIHYTTEDKEHYEEHYNGDLLDFYNLNGDNTLYVKVTNKSSTSAGPVLLTIVFGEA